MNKIKIVAISACGSKLRNVHINWPVVTDRYIDDTLILAFFFLSERIGYIVNGFTSLYIFSTSKKNNQIFSPEQNPKNFEKHSASGSITFHLKPLAFFYKHTKRGQIKGSFYGIYEFGSFTFVCIEG